MLLIAGGLLYWLNTSPRIEKHERNQDDAPMLAVRVYQHITKQSVHVSDYSQRDLGARPRIFVSTRATLAGRRYHHLVRRVRIPIFTIRQPAPSSPIRSYSCPLTIFRHCPI